MTMGCRSGTSRCWAWVFSVAVVLSLVAPTSALAIGLVTPTTVTDLTASALFARGAVVSWTSPADAGGLSAASYTLKYSTSPILSEADFAGASPVAFLKSPLAPGLRETIDVTGLSEGTGYFFALRWTDSSGAVSPLSNVPFMLTLGHDEFVMKTVAKPLYAPNDYTATAFQFSSDSYFCGLDPSSSYYYRVVYSDTPAINASTDRGWTAFDYNQTNTRWASTADTWTACPTLETDGNGKPNSGPKGVWSTLRVGDTRETGVHYTNVLMIKRDASGNPVPGSEKHSVNPAPVTIFDPNSDGAWLHNGTQNPNGPSRVAVTDLVPWPNHKTYGLSQGYPRWSQPDDPYFGTPDIWGGSLRFALPLGLGPLDVRVGNEGQTSWTSFYGTSVTGLQLVVAGASYAFGASDFTPPSAPASLTASSRGYPKDIMLRWSAAADDTAVTGYYVYRWQDADPGAPYTSMKRRIGIVRGGRTYLDSAVTLGERYHYEVRAFDDATNVSPAIGVSATSESSIGPARIDDLAVVASSVSSVTLEWTAISSSSAEGTTAVTAYDLRYSATPILTEAEFASATPTGIAVTPGLPGTVERAVLADTLFNGQTYYFAVQAIDAAALKGAVSNSPDVTMPFGESFTLTAASVVAPSMAPNDHTALSIHFGGAGSVATGLDANARYLARVVFSSGASEDRATDRGWTAIGGGYPDNGWRHIDEPLETVEPSAVASRCVLVTNTSGQFVGDPGLVVARFGDTRVSGTYRLGVELIELDGDGRPIPGRTRVLADPPTITVFDAATMGSGVHNGWSPEDAAASDVSVRSNIDPTTGVAAASGYPAYFGEEPPAPWDSLTPSAGAFSMSLPLSVTSFGLYRNGAPWAPSGTPLSYIALPRVAGASYALGSAIEAVPVAPSAITSASLDASGLAGALRLTWERPSGDAVGYRVYRWQDAPAGALYTPPKRCVATVGDVTGTVDTGLAAGGSYRYEIRAFDAAGNLSPPFGLSGTEADRVVPATISDLSVEATATGRVTLGWTAPADTAAGTDHATVASYDLRYSLSPIVTTEDFDAATKASLVPTPAVPGSSETFTVARLANGATYHFAVRALDAAGNPSAPSNRASAELPALPFYSLTIRSAPRYVANDHTPNLIQIGTPATDSGLAPNAVYYYKAVFSESVQRDATTDRGWTAVGNETPNVVWIHADEDWSRFPTLTTNADGAIIETGSNGLGLYARFGDSRLTGVRYLQVILARKSSEGTAAIPGSEVYPSAPTTVTVFDPTTEGAWVHNGVANTLGAARVSLAVSQGATECLAIAEGYPRWLFAPDDLPYEGSSLSGSFRMAVPTLPDSFGVYTGNSNSRVWMAQDGLVVTVPGASYAAGASDMVPPSAPATIAASSLNEARNIRVSWSGAADDNGVAGYYIYRWQDAPAAARYTPEKSRLATITSGDEYLDRDVVLGQAYHYEVRTFDAATNLSPALETSATSSDAVPPHPVLDLAIERTAKRTARLTWTAPVRGVDEAVASYELRRSTQPILSVTAFEAATLVPLGTPLAPGGLESFSATGLPTGSNYFSLRSIDANGNKSALSNTVAVSISDTTTAQRLQATNRYTSAIAFAKVAYPGFKGVKHVVIACGDDRAAADPLAAAGLCGVFDAPLLLVSAAGASAELIAALDSMPETVTVHFVGGTGSVPESIVSKIKARSKVAAVERIQGADRYKNAAAIADKMKAVLGSDMPTTALIANGAEATKFCDALSLSAVSARTHYPILLVSGTSVPGATSSVLTRLGLKKRFIAGGSGTVSEGVRRTLGVAVADRLWGANRYSTSVAVANRALAEGWLEPTQVAIAATQTDALPAGPLIGRSGGVLLFTPATFLDATVRTYLQAHRTTIFSCKVYGSTGSLNAATVSAIDAALRAPAGMAPSSVATEASGR